MTCRQVGGAVVCSSDNFLRKVITRCPIDECMTEMVASHAAWYGTTYYCCKCGDSWENGQLMMRPFARRWRRDAVKRYRRLWVQATFGPPPSLAQLYPELADEGETDWGGITLELPGGVA